MQMEIKSSMFGLSKFLRDQVGSKNSLRRQAVVGGHWLLGRSIVIAIIEMMRAAIFARVLFPGDYGLMALATMAIGLMESFSATGAEVMIQRDGPKALDKLPSLWTVKVTRGMALTLLTWTIALPLSRYYQRPELLPLIGLLSLTFVFKGLAGFGREMRFGQMNFKRVAITEMAASIIELIAGLTALFFLRNVWALATYSVISAVIQMLMSYFLFPWKPRMGFDASVWRQLAGYAGSIVFLNVFNYIFVSFDVATVGKLLGIDSLGFYARASFLALLPATYLANVVAPIFLPAFGQLATDPERLRAAFWKSMTAMTGFFLVVGAGMALCGKWMILLVYGERWLSVLPAFRILLIFGIAKAVMAVVPTMFFVKGKPWLLSVAAGIMVLILLLTCVPFTQKWGIAGTAWAIVLAALMSHVVSLGMVTWLMRERTVTGKGGA